MRHLENNGYANVAGLERLLAVKTDNYKEKNLLHEIFSKSRIGDTELFAVDENLVKRLFYRFAAKSCSRKRNGGIGI
ncbi:Uncharacterised protein [Neisseria gonorrhoeae]|uniref:Uncharacterized protein n=1 Tax=Neisseria gonorrhoeae TaxID=485 RepID=A0A378VYV3_NEIGO|nr:Uncharacterised protein [Neisseria gonorrhoeae]